MELKLPLNGQTVILDLIATLANPRKNLAQGVLFSLEDTLKVKREAKALIIVNDEGGVPGELKQAVKKYNYPLLGWSEREKLSREYLAAGFAA